MQRKISIILVVVVVLLVFRKFFLPSTLVWGDAPYFYFDGFKDLLNVSIWTTRGNIFGNVNLFLWIYPIMFIYGLLGNYLHLSNDLILRILFYFPSLIFGISGTYLLTKYFNFTKIVTFFSVFIYIVNTYYILLVDGGQVGVVLAYGLFPLTLYFLNKVLDKQNLVNFLISLSLSFLLTVVDFRVSAICFVTLVVLRIFSIKKFGVIVLLGISLVALSLYWIIPVLYLASSQDIGVSLLQTTSLVNSLFLFSSNWPYNQFGSITPVYFYFCLIPVLIFLPIFFIKERKIIWLTMCFLLFAFLAKGISGPGGEIYSLLISNKFGSVFRDSTKFFIPLVLIGGILIGHGAEVIRTFVKTKNVYVVISIYLAILMTPAILGNLTGTLGKNSQINKYYEVSKILSNDAAFARSAWFTEKSPFAYHTEEKQALDARELVNYRAFASMSVGTGDRFNFINNKNYLDWFSLMGVKYLVLSGNPRVTELPKSDKEDWDRLNNLLANDMRLKKINSEIPVYKNENIYPNKFFVNKVFVVIGGDDVYDKFRKINKDFSVGNQGILFSEDGKTDLEPLQEIASTSAVLIFNNKSFNDLKMGFFKDNFINIKDNLSSQWAVEGTEDYLKYKFELLIRKLEFKEFDYGKGVAFSDQDNESITFRLNAPYDGKYYLGVRTMSTTDSGNLKISFNGTEKDVKRETPQRLEWYEDGPFDLKKGDYEIKITNTHGLNVVNTLGLFSFTDMAKNEKLANDFTKYFETINLDGESDKRISELLNDKWSSESQVGGWMVYTDTYNEHWKGFPFYSMINGFYVDKKFDESKIIFRGQDYLRWGIYWSTISLFVITIIVLWKKSYK